MPDQCAFIQYAGDQIDDIVDDIRNTAEYVGANGLLRVQLEATLQNYQSLNSLVGVMRQEISDNYYLSVMQNYRSNYYNLCWILKTLHSLFTFDVTSEETIYIEVSCDGSGITISDPVIGAQEEGKPFISILNDEVIRSMGMVMNISFQYYICIGKASSPGGISKVILQSLMEMVEKNLHLTNSVNFKQDANLKYTHSKSFVKFLNDKVKDNSDTLLEKLGLSSFVSSAQTELDLPSSSSSALALYTAVQGSVDWWTDLLNLFIDFINELNEYNQNSKIDRLLECNFDAKKFNRLLGDALNYAMKDAGTEDPNHQGEYMFPVVSRNDQQYIDLNPDGQACLDWDGGLPALVNHRHYNFKKVWCVGQLEPLNQIPYKLYIIPNWIEDLPQMVSPSDHPDKI